MIFIAMAFCMLAFFTGILVEGEKKLTFGFEEKTNCKEFVKDFMKMDEDCIGKILKVKKSYQYNVFTNEIGIPDPDSEKLFDVISSLHEAGHYICINKSKINMIIYKYSQVCVAFSRLFLIPSIFVLFVLWGKVYTTLLVLCLVCTFLRISIGITHEYKASRIAYQYYLSKTGYKEYGKIAKKVYILCFLNQLFMTFSVAFLMLALYYGKSNTL